MPVVLWSDRQAVATERAHDLLGAILTPQAVMHRTAHCACQ
jgi:hypothetical protein